MTAVTMENTEKYRGNDRLITGIVLGVLTFWLFAQSTYNIVPDLRVSINIPQETLSLAISLTALFSGCFIVVLGGLADRFGRVRMTYLGFILNILGCLCLISATETYLFAIGRIIQGFSAACIMPATLALVKTYYEGKERQRALSFWSIGSWGGSGLCIFVGGAIATYFGWRAIFMLSIVFSLLGMLLLKGTPESKGDAPVASRFDYSGLITFVIALLSLNLLITQGNRLGWQSMPIVILFVVLCVSLVLFFTIELKKKAASFIDFSLFKNKAYRGTTLSNFLLNAVAGTLIVSSTYIQQGRGFSAFQSGMLTLGYLIAILVMIRVGEKVLQLIGAKKPMMLGTLLTACGVTMMSLTFLSDTFYAIAMLTGYIFFGLGLGFYATPSADTMLSNAPTDKVGIASGIFKMASSLGGAFSITLSMSIYTMLSASGLHHAASMALLLNVGFCMLSFVIIVFMVPKEAGKTPPSKS